MKIFKKKEERKTGLQSRYAAAEMIARPILTSQRKMAAYLRRKTQYWNQGSKWIALILFGAAFGGFSLYLILKAVL